MRELDKYPVDVRTEDLTLYAKELENETGMDATALVFAEPVQLNEFEGVVLQAGEETNALMRSFQYGMSVSAALTYSQMKTLLDYIYDTDAYTSVGAVSVRFNAETAALIGTIEVNKFYLTYPDAPELDQPMPAVPRGNTNLFGSMG